ncbi:unnamed protein product [Prorocentrum cordatum]|uniref:Uncharacterized protein n=1 Tax=Prorocentrum cordatum TaxID=2364126 RepID=A0ABN9TL69_9DINO|nr:unnamed protein product [Polarella glacialis]
MASLPAPPVAAVAEQAEMRQPTRGEASGLSGSIQVAIPETAAFGAEAGSTTDATDAEVGEAASRIQGPGGHGGEGHQTIGLPLQRLAQERLRDAGRGGGLGGRRGQRPRWRGLVQGALRQGQGERLLLVFRGCVRALLLRVPALPEVDVDEPDADRVLENEDYDKWPALQNQTFIKADTSSQYSISMSRIPRTTSGCNLSCIGFDGTTSSGYNEMSFNVDVTLNATGFEYSAFPLLLASNDWSNWWLAADRTDSTPHSYFPSSSPEESSVYRHECTRPPEFDRDSEGNPVAPAEVRPEELYASTPTYVMVCVVWHSEKVNWHNQHNTMAPEELASQCDSVGGVCGWSCGSNPNGGSLPGCSAGLIDVEANSVAGVRVPEASFSGAVSVRACTDEPGTEECTTTSALFPKWPCRQCVRKTPEAMRGAGGQGDELVYYDSLPRMEVLLKDAAINDATADAAPRAYILTSPMNIDGAGPAGMLNGTWTKLYDPITHPEPLPVSVAEAQWAEEPEVSGDETTTLPPTVDDVGRHKMHFFQKNKLSLKPSRCFGQSGPLYLVACAVNESTYRDSFEMIHGQTVAPPPFNDRCIAVTGRCAHACMDTDQPLEHCTADGFIKFDELSQEDIETPTNNDMAVNMFVFTLMVGFAVKLVTYLPGLFIPYKHPKYYDPSMTAELKYIAICAPSGGETKACVLRNLVGAVSTLPKNCQCPFHVIFADEGHRHPQKVMFRALASVLHHVPDHCVNQTMADNGRSPRQSMRNFKEENLKAFTKLWVEQTRMCRLDGCNTDKIANKIKALKKGLEDPSQPTDAIKKMEKAIDDLAGVTALKTLQARAGWPKGDADESIKKLEAALLQLRLELCVGEKTYDGAGACDAKKPMHLDDCENISWTPARSDWNPNPQPLYTVHYLARAKPDEDDERILKVQHVARGMWYYKIPMLEEKRTKKSWLEWRQTAQEFTDADFDKDKYIVPLRTSRGKAGGLNFRWRTYSITPCTWPLRTGPPWNLRGSSMPCSVSPTPVTNTSLISCTRLFHSSSSSRAGLRER